MAATTAELVAASNALLSEHAALISRLRTQQAYRRTLLPLDDVQIPEHQSCSPSPEPDDVVVIKDERDLTNLPPSKRARCMRYRNYVPAEETIRNDYSQRYVDGGEWPQNWVLGSKLANRFEEYPKQRRLLTLKRSAVNSTALPPRYLPLDDLAELYETPMVSQPTSIASLPANPLASTPTGLKFDVILIDPPPSINDVQDLPIPQLAADPSFVFLWVGSGAGCSTVDEEGEKGRLTLERGREVLAKWGYRRCEDVCWVKTNNEKETSPGTDPPTSSMLVRTKEHCLMGIRGTVRRSTDSWFIHCNVDTDLLIAAPSSTDPTLKPTEMYALIENFCLGARRLEIGAKRPRRGWVSVVSPTALPAYLSYFNRQEEEEEEDPTLTEGLKDEDAESNNNEEEMDVEKAKPQRFDRASWEPELARLLGLIPLNAPSGYVPPQSARWVVPTSAETETLRPKSPVRGAKDVASSSSPNVTVHSNPGGGTSGGVRFGVPSTANAVQRSGGMVPNMLPTGVVGMGAMQAPQGMNTFGMNPEMEWMGATPFQPNGFGMPAMANPMAFNQFGGGMNGFGAGQFGAGGMNMNMNMMGQMAMNMGNMGMNMMGGGVGPMGGPMQGMGNFGNFM